VSTNWVLPEDVQIHELTATEIETGTFVMNKIAVALVVEA
jgi:hypothetical protein